MSILKILAGIILVASVVTFIVQLKKGNTKSSVLFVTSALLSVGLYFLAGQVENKLMAADAETATSDAAQTALTDQAAPTAEAPEVVAAAPLAEAPAAENEEPSQADGDFDFVDSGEQPAAAEAPAAVEAPAAPEVPAAAEAPAAVEDDPLAPTAVAGNAIDDAKINETIKFDGSRSKKNEAAIKAYHWDFGDGTSAETAKASHAYKEQGDYNAVLTITDADGHKAQAVRQVSVNRPENKIRFIENKKVADASKVKSSPNELSGQFTKKFKGSKAILEAKANIVSADGCTCSLTVSLNGPGCNVTQTKKLSDGGEGETTARTQCHGEVGDYTWSIKRTTSESCECSWLKMSIDGYES